ncbi:MAG TPA: acetate kinase, partial [Sporolactobacillaceae bacterium]|nr:acetate kinase [Sporolactobacillaceae bacterium]
MGMILAVNAGSSSLKFQLLQMPEETIVTKGLFERIRLPHSVLSYEVKGEKKRETLDIPDHGVAVKILLERLMGSRLLPSLDELDGIGQRVVHGGELFSHSVLIDDKVIEQIEEVSELAPLHNPANLIGIRAFRDV